MLSSGSYYDRTHVKRLNDPWSRPRAVPTVYLVTGSDADYAAFKRRLGVVLSLSRRRLSSYTQQTIADELGIDKETIGRWERGEREPKSYQLHRMATLYCAPSEPPWDLFLSPPDSLTEVDLRVAQLRAAAAAAAQAAAEADDGPPSSGGRAARRGKR